MRCAALGCGSTPGKNGLFCLGHWRKLLPELRAPDKFREAMTYLGKKEGYLVDPPKRRPVIVDNEEQECV